jgi:hypothetical protein
LPQVLEQGRKHWVCGLPLPLVVSFLRAFKPGVEGSSRAGRATFGNSREILKALLGR